MGNQTLFINGQYGPETFIVILVHVFLWGVPGVHLFYGTDFFFQDIKIDHFHYSGSAGIE